jgi:inorganic pyrophosphatase
LPTYHPETGELLAVIETPKGSRNKLKLDEDLGCFLLAKALPAGAMFPFDFGFIPQTAGEDGDPVDVLVLMDDPVPLGCVVEIRLLGAIEADQTERDGKTERNDRLIAVAVKSNRHADIKALTDLAAPLLQEIEHFFISYNMARGTRFEVRGRSGPQRAQTLLKEGVARHRRKGRR